MAVWQGMVGSWRRPPFSDGRCRRLPGQGAVRLHRLRLYANADTNVAINILWRADCALKPGHRTKGLSINKCYITEAVGAIV